VVNFPFWLRFNRSDLDETPYPQTVYQLQTGYYYKEHARRQLFPGGVLIENRQPGPFPDLLEETDRQMKTAMFTTFIKHRSTFWIGGKNDKKEKNKSNPHH
jgi:hypothetical protein